MLKYKLQEVKFISLKRYFETFRKGFAKNSKNFLHMIVGVVLHLKIS